MRGINTISALLLIVYFWKLPAVLVPRFDLSVGESEFGCQFQAVLNAQILLTLETLLQCLQLVVGEGRPGFASFFAHGRLVGSVAFARCAPAVVMTAATNTAPIAFIIVVIFSCKNKLNKLKI